MNVILDVLEIKKGYRMKKIFLIIALLFGINSWAECIVVTDNGSNRYIDTKGNLEHDLPFSGTSQETGHSARTWSAAVDYCRYKPFVVGTPPWRLPNINELLSSAHFWSISDISEEKADWKGCRSNYGWSSTTLASSNTVAYTIVSENTFGANHPSTTLTPKTHTYKFRCVKDIY